jgi:hypothetical protein
LATTALAGPEWPETGDAGPLPNDAQPVFGSGILDKVSGTLEGFSRASDFQDMFLIRVGDFTTFNASTQSMVGASDTTFDVQLCLFDASGLGQLANDNISTLTTDAATQNAATDGSGFALTSNGLYFLAISGFNSDPLSAGATQPIFNQATPTEISGPDGTGGSLPVDGWSVAGSTGFYRVFLTSAEFVCLGDFDDDGDVDGADLAAFLSLWGTSDFFADFTGDGIVDGADLAALLANWGRC